MRTHDMQIPETWERTVPLAPFTSWKIGGPARFLSQPSDPPSLASDLRAASDLDLPVFPLGGGSNLLISDEGFAGLVIRYMDKSVRLRIREEDEETAVLKVGTHAPLAGTARAMAYRGWQGLEWAEGIPGTVGGAIVGNAGAYGGNIAQSLIQAEVFLEGARREVWPAQKLQFSYRRSMLRDLPPGHAIILSGEFLLRRDDPKRLRQQMDEIAARRRKGTPAGLSCGSVFRNPPGDAAGRLIDGAGLKGARCGGAHVSEDHANYILNDASATARDVLTLIRTVRDRVRDETGVTLIPEIRFVGFPPNEVDDLTHPPDTNRPATG
jgi:UDP-N-acetylmuramate dehydrogenase